MSTNPHSFSAVSLAQSPAQPWWRGATVYQVYPRSFQDSDGDGVGDLRGITRRLDHIASLGVDAIWLSPFFTSPMRDFGYDISNYCDVDHTFGTLADFDALVAGAHARGLRIIIDQVYAHTSDLHPWFSQSRAARDGARHDWYVWADAKPDGSPPNNWQSVFGGPAWTWDARRGQYYMHNFLKEQPQLNCHNPEVQEALLAVARFWMDRGVDGFRVDAINFAMHNPSLADNPPAPPSNAVRTRPFDFQLKINNQSHPDIPGFIERLRQTLDSYGDRFTVAEVGGNDAEREMKLFTQGDGRFHSAYGFNFLYADRLTPALVREAVEAWPDDPGLGWPSWALSNHDAPRWISRWAPAGQEAAYARMVMMLFAALRGNIILWQGEELGLTQVDIPFEKLQDPEAIANWPLTLSRDGTRTPMAWEQDAPNLGFTAGEPWLPVGPDHAMLAVDVQERDAGSMLHWTRTMLAVRAAQPALKWGDMKVLLASDDILVFARRFEGQTLLCAFNMGNQSVAFTPPMPVRPQPIACCNGASAEHLPAYSSIVLEAR